MKRRVISLILAMLLSLSVFGFTATAADDNAVVVTTEQELRDAIEAIPVGGSGEITLENTYMGLSDMLYFENKDITFNLIDASLSTYADDNGFGVPVIFGFGANITVNMNDYSSLHVYGHTGNMGVVRVDNSTDWNATTQSFEKDFSLVINGGAVYGSEMVLEETEDATIVAAPGVKVELKDVFCSGKVEAVAMEGVDINTPGTLVINSGKFTNDVKSYVAAGKYCGEENGIWYVRESEMSDEFSSMLTDGKLVLNYVKPESVDSDAIPLISEGLWYEYPDYLLMVEGFSEDLSKCTISIFGNTGKEEVHTVEVVWNYDEEINKLAKEVIKNIPEDKQWFKVTDLELVNYWVYHDPLSMEESLVNYSGELKSYIGNSNFTFPVEDRAGGGAEFITERIGSAKLVHEGTAYASFMMLGARAEHVIYVPESTGNTAEAVMAAAQKRIDDYIGKGAVELELVDMNVEEYIEAVKDMYESEIEYYTNLLNAELAKPENERDQLAIWNYEDNIEYNRMYLAGFIADVADDGDLAFINKAAGGYIFFAHTEKNADNAFVVIKDDDKLAVPTYKTVDISTKVEVNTESAEVPLDTVISSEKITSGTEYDKIVKALGVKENATYDINLFSVSLDDYVTKLENGKFEVKLPVPKELEGKKLTVYYVDANNKVVEYNVEVKDGYAVFETDHFSIYTLAEAKTANPPTADMNLTFIIALMLCAVAVGLGIRKIKSL